MAAPLMFDYDEVGDILYVQACLPYAEQETVPLEYNIVARKNPGTGAIECLEILFFTRWLTHSGQARNLTEFFAQPASEAHA